MIKATIIIITHNRSSCLRRLLDYYKRNKNDFKIIVADSSSDENKIVNKEIISSFPDLDILYLYDYSDKVEIRYQFADAINHVKTKYCLLCADDDFITPKGIKQSVNFLESNPDFTVALGYFISFYSKTKKRGEKQFYWKPLYSHKSITFPDPKLRLAKHLSDYSLVTIFGVHRADFFKMIFRETLKFTDAERFAELLPSMLTLIYGKMKCLDVLYAVREITLDSSGIAGEDIYDFIKEGSYNGKYTKFRNCLATHLSKKSHLKIEESEKVIDDAMSAYLKKYYPNKYQYLLKYLPGGMYEKIRALYVRTRLTFPKRNFSNSTDNLPSKYYNDFTKIRDCVISHAKSNK